MATLPFARTSVVDTAVASAGGLDLVCVVAPVSLNADAVPRIMGSAADVVALHGYCDGAEYVAYHKELTGKSVLFCGVPIVTVGAIGRENTSGNTGTASTTLAAGSSGVLCEHDGVLRAKNSGYVGTSQIMLEYSLDSGRTFKTVRLGTATSYEFPHSGVTVTLAEGGSLKAGDTIHTWHGTAPRSDSTGWLTARTELAKQAKGFRSVILIGDLQNSTEVNSWLAQWDAYRTSHDRFTRARASVLDRLPQAALSQTRSYMTGSPTLTFAEVNETGDTITRSAGSWVADGVAVGDTIVVAGSTNNNVTGVITAVSATVLTLGDTDLVDEGPVSNCTVYATPTLTFAEVGMTGDTIRRNRGSWLLDGFRVGDAITVASTASNNISDATLAGVTATVLTLGSTDLTAEVVKSYGVSITAGQTQAAWMTTIDSAFASVDGAFRVGLSAGRGRRLSPLSGWYARRPAAWAASIREYQHDVHIPTWRKDDGPVGWDIFDADGNLSEWDDRVYGGAGCAARFTVFRTWANGPAGAFLALDLTRMAEGSLLTQAHNVDVVNLACTIVQRATENVVGRVLVLNRDGTATSNALASIEAEVNAALRLALLVDKGEGPRASAAVWTAAKTDVLNVPEAQLNGVLDLNLNGTIHSVVTNVRVISGGQQ